MNMYVHHHQHTYQLSMILKKIDCLILVQLLNRATLLRWRGKVKVILFLNTLLHADADQAAVSQYVERASVSYLSGSDVQIECEFKEGIERASCVVVFRDDGNKTLIVKEYPQNTVFPITLTVDGDPKNYTFAIFGKRGTVIDERPIVEGRVSFIPRKTTLTSPTTTPSGMCGLMHGDSKVICHLLEDKIHY